MAGNISILRPKDNYQRVSKVLILDKTVDPLTLGIYVKVISLGEKWALNVKGLARALEVSEDKVRKAFATLEAKGFLRRTKAQDSRGRFNGWDYEIGAVPLSDIAKTPTSENTDIGENRRRENRPLYKDNISKDIDIYPNSEIDKREGTVPRKTQGVAFIPPSLEEVQAYCDERGNTVDPEAFVAFYASKGWKIGSTPMKDWKAAVVTWEKREAARPEPARESRRPRHEESVYLHNMKVQDQLLGTHTYEDFMRSFYGKNQ